MMGKIRLCRKKQGEISEFCGLGWNQVERDGENTFPYKNIFTFRESESKLQAQKRPRQRRRQCTMKSDREVPASAWNTVAVIQLLTEKASEQGARSADTLRHDWGKSWAQSGTNDGSVQWQQPWIGWGNGSQCWRCRRPHYWCIIMDLILSKEHCYPESVTLKAKQCLNLRAKSDV